MTHTSEVGMLSAGDVLKMLVGLKEVGDLDIVSSDAVLSSTCRNEDRPTVLAMAAIVEQLLDVFDYEESPEFQSKINGKSDDVQAMHRKLLSPDRRKKLLTRFGKALTELLVSEEAFDLVPSENHDRLSELRALASRISN